MQTYRERMQEVRDRLVLSALAEANGSISVAARKLGVNRTHFYALSCRPLRKAMLPRSRTGAYHQAMIDAICEYVTEVRATTNGRLRESAMVAGVSRTHFCKLMHRAGIPPRKYGNEHWRALG